MPGLGHKQTSRGEFATSALPRKADFVEFEPVQTFCASLSSAQFWFGGLGALIPSRGFDLRQQPAQFRRRTTSQARHPLK